jgi:thiol-disulfide isomerase/thioredoxin
MGLPRTLFLVPIGLSILLSSFAVPAQTPKSRAAKPSSAVRASLPSVTEINTDALKALLKRDSERPLLVNFWATWCDPCRDEFPDLVKIDQQYRPGSLDFAAISLDDPKDLRTEVPRFLQQMNATMPAYLLNVPDPEPAITAVDPKWQGDLPATFLYNAKGEVVYKHFGRVNVTELRRAIEQLVGSKQ